MARLVDQLTRIVKFSKIMKEGIVDDEDKDLLEIDNSLEKTLDESLNLCVENLIKGD